MKRMNKWSQAGMALLGFSTLGLGMVQANDGVEPKPVLTCWTEGDGLGVVRLYEERGKAMVKINYSEADEEEVPPVYYKVRTSFRNIKRNDSDTLVAQQVGAEDLMHGGRIGKAIILRVLPGQKKAIMGAQDSVYDLVCKK